MKLFFFFVLISPFSFGQIGLGEIHGTLIDEDGEFIPFIQVLIYSSSDEGEIKAGTQSDFDGYFRLTALPEGTYNLVLASDYYEFDTVRIENVNVKRNEINRLGEIKMNANRSWTDARIPEIAPCVRIGFEDPFGRSFTIMGEDIRRH